MSNTVSDPGSNTSSNNTKDRKDPVQTVIANDNDVLLNPVQLEKQPYNNNTIHTPSPITEQQQQQVPLKNNLKRVSKKDISSTSISAAARSTNSNNKKKKKGSKKKTVCFYPDCTNIASKFIGDCDFCNGHYCSNHRLMESHHCNGLDTCKEKLHQRNADKLNKEQTLVPKIQI